MLDFYGWFSMCGQKYRQMILTMYFIHGLYPVYTQNWEPNSKSQFLTGLGVLVSKTSFENQTWLELTRTRTIGSNLPN